MSSILVTSTKTDLYKSGGTADHLINISGINDIIGSAGLTIYNSISGKINETIQYFLTYDDVIKVVWFGKGVGSIVVDGTMFSDCDGDLPGISKFHKAISDLRGTVSSATIGSLQFDVMITDATVTVVGHPDTLADFQVTLAVLNHNM
jgi:hypothetical protein